MKHTSKPGYIIRFTATPEGADEFATLLQRLLEHVNAEQGTTTWFAARSEEQPETFFISDVFTDGDARQAHFTGDAAKLLLAEAGPLLAGQPDVQPVATLATKNV